MNAQHTSNRAGDEFIVATAEDIEETLTYTINDSPAYALILDETIGAGNIKQLALVAKYVDQKCGNVIVDIIKDVKIQEVQQRLFSMKRRLA